MRRRKRPARARAVAVLGFVTACVALVGAPATAGALASPTPIAGTAAITGGGLVDAVVPDGTGGWYIGGGFSTAGAVAHSNLAHILANGSVDPAFNATVDDTVTSLVLSAGVLYAGGYFAHSGTTARNGVASFDATTGALETAFNPNVTTPGIGPSTYALALSGTTLFVGGNFTQAKGQNRPGLAAFDTTTGALLTTFTTAPDDEAVQALAVGSQDLYVGGDQGLAGLNLATGAGDPTFNPNLDVIPGDNDVVLALLVDGSRLYAGGGFSMVNGVPRNDIAAVDATTGALDPSFDPSPGPGPFTNPVVGTENLYLVTSLALSGNTLYAGGNFTTVNDGAAARSYLADFDLVKGTTGAFNANITTAFGDTPIDALADSGSVLFAAGHFSTVSGVPESGFVEFPDTPMPPTAITGAAGAIGNTGATLAGSVTPNALATAYTFEYGTTTSFGTIAPVVELDNAITPEPLSQTVNGLTPNTTYLYRIVATNSAGTTSGPVMSFTTTGTPQTPTVATGAATSPTSTGVTLAGTVNPDAQQTTYTFEYGTTNSFGSISPPVALDNAGQVEPVSSTLTGLTPNRAYLYRIVATNATGTSSGSVASFTTTP